MRGVTALAFVLATPCLASAQPLLSEETFRYEKPWCPLLVDGGLVVAMPSALPAGIARGVGVGFSRGELRWGRFAWGARAAWVATSEAAPAWQVSHDEVRLRLTGSLRQTVGRGTFALRLGVGGTFVRERRVRHQGMRAGLDGDELETRALALLPAASLEGVLSLHVRGPWSLVIAGGPTVTYDDRARGGFVAEIGVAWQP